MGAAWKPFVCDHGRDRHAGRQLALRRYRFRQRRTAWRGLLSARAAQVEIPQPAGEIAGPVAELPGGEWLAAYRVSAQSRFGIYSWRPGEAAPRETLYAAANANALQPVLLAAHEGPKRFPSALGNREGANLLCLNVYTSRSAIPAHSVATVRAWALGDDGKPVAAGPCAGGAGWLLLRPGAGRAGDTL